MKATKRPRQAPSKNEETRPAELPLACTASPVDETHRERDSQSKTYSASNSASTSPTALLLLNSETFSTKEHASITSRTETSDTMDLYGRLDELSLQWSTQRGTLRATSATAALGSPDADAHGFLDDGSLLSFGSFASQQQQQLPTIENDASDLQGKAVIDIPRRLLNKKGGQFRTVNSLSSHASVFDRLYEDAKEKTNARRRKDHVARNMRSMNSVGASTITSRLDVTAASGANESQSSSVYERLYRNERQRAKQGRRTPSKNITAAHNSMSVLERRLQYTPPESALPKGYRQRQPQYGSPTVASVRSWRTSMSSPISSPRRPHLNGNRDHRTLYTTSSSTRSPISPLTPASVLERRLQYKPPDSALPKRSSRNVAPMPPLLSPSSPSPKAAASHAFVNSPQMSLSSHTSDVFGDDMDDLLVPQRIAAITVTPPRQSLVAFPPKHEDDDDPAAVDNVMSACHASMILSRGWRMSRERKVYLAKRLCAVIIQAVGRGHLVRRRFQIMPSRKLDPVLADTAECSDTDIVCVITTECELNITHLQYEEMTDDEGPSKIQSSWRMSRVRRTYLGKKASAISIQNWWRQLYWKFLYQEKRATAIRIIQHLWRGYCIGRANGCRRRRMIGLLAQAWDDNQTLNANMSLGLVEHDGASTDGEFMASASQSVATTIDARHGPNLRLQLRHEDTISFVDSNATASSFDSDSSIQFIGVSEIACFRIQTWWRAMLVLRQSAATKIQCVWRRSEARATIISSRTAVMLIQSMYRMVIRRRAYAKELHEVLSLIARDRASVCIQATWRCFLVRRRSAYHRVAAVIVQSVVRKSLFYGKYQKIRIGVILAQRRIRMKFARRLSLRDDASVTIQSCWRCRNANYHYLRLRVVVTMIQADARMRQNRDIYLKFRTAVGSLQVRFREHQKEMIKSIMVVQNAWRRATIKRRLITKVYKATAIQMVWRGSNARSTFVAMRAATVIMQSIRRGYVCRIRYVGRLHAVRTIQRYGRGSTARRALHDIWLCNARQVLAIQCKWRSFKARSKYLSGRAAAMLIQTFYRTFCCRKRYMKTLMAVRTIQSLCHLSAMRTGLRQWRELIMSEYRVASTAIQGAWRKSSAIQRYNASRGAIITIQAAARRSSCQAKYRRLCFVVAIIQRRARSRIAWLRKLIAAANGIQHFWWSMTARRRYLRAQAAILLLQCQFRRLNAYRYCTSLRKQRKIDKTAAHLTQLTWRNYQVKGLRAVSVVAIQSIWRSFSRHRKHKRCLAAATALQSAWRRRKMKMHYEIQVHYSTVIQSAWRKFRAMSGYSLSRKYIIIIQSCFRRALSNAHYMKILGFHLAQVTRIQASWRRHISIRAYETTRIAAVLAQSVARMHLNRMKYASAQYSVIAIQCACRSMLARRRFIHLKREAAALAFQNKWRSHRRHSLRKKLRSAAATVIQAQWRSSAARTSYRCIRTCVAIVQSIARKRQQTINYQSKHLSTIKIQALYRGVLARQVAERFQQRRGVANASARMIQRAYITHSLRLKCLSQVAAASLIQKKIRIARMRSRFRAMEDSACTLQRYARTFLVKFSLLRRDRAAVRLQCIARGWRARDRYALLSLLCVRFQALLRGAICRMRQTKHIENVTRLQAFMRGCLSRRIDGHFSIYATVIGSVLEELTTSTDLLQLAHAGTVIKSNSARFALSSINKCLRSPTTEAFVTMSLRMRLLPPIMAAWMEKISLAKQLAAVPIQRAFTAYRARLHFRHLETRRWRSKNLEVVAIGFSDPSRSIFVEVHPHRGRGRAHSVPPTQQAGCAHRKGVAVMVTGSLDNTCLLVQFSEDSFARQNEAAQIMQAFTRRHVVGPARRTRLCRELLRRIEESAQTKVAQILQGTRSASNHGPCVNRLAERAKHALLMGACEMKLMVAADNDVTPPETHCESVDDQFISDTTQVDIL